MEQQHRKEGFAFDDNVEFDDTLKSAEDEGERVL
jgi:hypothetical protein